MKNIIMSLIIVFSLNCFGCASDKEMGDKFGDNLPHLFIEKKTGDKYIITHSFGDNYNVKRLVNIKGE